MKNITLLLGIAFLAHAGDAGARSFVPPVKRMMSPGFDGTGPKINMVVVYGGIMAGGKQNTCRFVKTKVLLASKLNLDGSLFYHFNGDALYSANIGYGNVIAFTAGMEWGDRRYYVNRDSTLEHIKFKNEQTGEYATYESFTGVTFPQQVNTLAIGITFNGRIISTNYWRGEGMCWKLMSVKWELLYAPKIIYDETFEVTTQGAYQEETAVYLLEGAKEKHFGFRLVVDTRMSSKIGFMLETGMRPGVKSEINEAHRFSNGYVKMGVAIGISVGGRRALREAE